MIYSFCVFIFRFQIFFWLLLFHFSFSFSVFRCFFHFQFLFCVFYFACFIFVFHVSFSFILFSSDNNKIGSSTVEVFLIWTNVTRTNVAWTNVIVTVGICSRYSHESTFKVSSKSGQLQLRYCWYGHMLLWLMLAGQMLP